MCVTRGKGANRVEFFLSIGLLRTTTIKERSALFTYQSQFFLPFLQRAQDSIHSSSRQFGDLNLGLATPVNRLICLAHGLHGGKIGLTVATSCGDKE